MELKPELRTEYVSAMCTPQVRAMLRQFCSTNSVSTSRAIAYILEVFLQENSKKIGVNTNKIGGQHRNEKEG